MHRIELIACVVFFSVHALCISVFDCITSRASVACVAYDNLETVCRPTKTGLKVSFQAAVRNATDATHAGHATQTKKNRNARNARMRKMQWTQG